MEHYTYQIACISHLDRPKRYRPIGTYRVMRLTGKPVKPSPEMGGYTSKKSERKNKEK